MVIAVLVALGLCFGSFANALVWRMYQQGLTRQGKVHMGKRRKRLLPNQSQYSILAGRSMCPHCRHELAAKDLVPVLSWLWLRGKCRYCREAISWQYPLVEVATVGLFLGSYFAWPSALVSWQWVSFGLWLAILVGLIALLVYDVRWQLLPNKVVFTLGALAILRAVVIIATNDRPLHKAALICFGALVGGGIFYVLFQLSAGQWIGGGDVKLGFVLGLVVGQPVYAFMLIFLAALLGTLMVIPPLLTKKASKTTRIPFGPFLIAGCYIALLWGAAIADWYQHTLMSVSPY